MEQLIGDRDNLELTDDFITGVNEQLARFKKEIKFRRDEEEAKRIAEEERKKRKAAAKKAKQNR